MSRLFLALGLLLAAGVVLAPPAAAQELNCRVSVRYDALQGNEFTFLADLREEIEEYLNGRSWTEDRFDNFERIDCTVSVTFTEAQGLDRFRAQLAVGAQRPIYATAQRTTVFQVVDSDWEFQYNRGQPLIYEEQRFSALESLLDFYALLILGYDYDTFSELGGTRYFERARQIAELGQAQGASGWVALGDDDTRTSLVRQLLDPRFVPLRRAYFLYHFGALDRFTRRPEEAWESGFSAVEALYELFLETSRRYATDVFFATKANELVELFEDFPERAQLYAILVEMDPARSSSYDRLTQ
ncbi:MAG: DUF4835 family protein [Rhodothermales bacterium]|nr:DUF4835 family protein [Rhodothermales bacterium]